MLFDLFFLLQFGSVFFVENIKMKDTDIYIYEFDFTCLSTLQFARNY